MQSFKDFHNQDNMEYKGYTFSFETEYEDDSSYNFYTVTTPEGKELSDVDFQRAGIKLPRDDDEAFAMVRELIDSGKI